MEKIIFFLLDVAGIRQYEILVLKVQSNLRYVWLQCVDRAATEVKFLIFLPKMQLEDHVTKKTTHF
jgi:hypothetical protein